MKMTELLRYGIPPEIIRLWQEQESEKLLPLQEMAIKRHDLFSNRNLLIQAPTSSGKTFIGEMAGIQTALRRKKVIYLVPLKALAEEKFEDFRAKYAGYGMDVLISTRDHREHDAQFERGNFSICVAVYEKLAQLLVRRPERLQEIHLVLADELELLSDPDRGADAEVLLTRILRSQCRMIGLSAVIGQAGKLAQWMNADLLLHERRPVELRYGVLHDGIFRYRTYNDYSEATEELIEVSQESSWEILTENLRVFAEQGESCLVFVKARHESRRGAELLANRVDLPAASKAIAALRRLDPTHSRDVLLDTLTHGVAFHNADLCREERRIIEEAFRSGEVRVVVATNTLAMGMNMPAQNVFITSDKWQYDARFGMPWKTPILRSEYENMGGRAARYGAEVAFGRSILIAPTPFDYETLWRRYVEGEREQVEPQLHRGPLEDHIVRLTASRTCVDEAEIQGFLEKTLTGSWIWRESYTPEEVGFRVRAAINRACDTGLLSRNSGGRLETTPFGQAAAAKGVSLATACELAKWIQESETRLWSDIDLILAAAMTPDGRVLQMTLTSAEYERADYPSQLKRVAQSEELSADVPLNRIRNCNLLPFYEEVRAIKVALVLMEWIDESSLYDMEEKYHTLMGQIAAAADQISWIIDATAAIATAFGANMDFIERVGLLSERVAKGLREEGLPLAQLRIPGLNRAAIIALEAHGLHVPETLAAAPQGMLSQWVDSSAAATLQAWAASHSGSVPVVSATLASSVPVLIIDDRHPGEIRLDGIRVRLQEKQYRLIRILAEHPGECVPYETIYAAVWEDAVVEPNQMHFQKRRLLASIREAIPNQEELVSTVPKRGFALNLAPNQVVLYPAAVTSAA